jgi:hypothetical protein
MSEQDFSFRIQNTGEYRLKVWLEPWGELYLLEPDKKLKVEVKGPTGAAPNNALEIQSSEDGITLWGWSGSTVEVNKL